MNSLEPPIDPYFDMGENQFRGFVEDEMHKHKNQAINKVEVLVHPDFAEDFARTLSYGYFEGIPEAKRLAKALNISNKHLAALEDDYQLMRTILREEQRDKEETDYEYRNY